MTADDGRVATSLRRQGGRVKTMYSRAKTYMLHAAVWMILLFSPLVYVEHLNDLSIGRFIYFSVNPILIIIVFYVDYLWLTPKYYAQGKRKEHVLINMLMIFLLGMALHEWMDYGQRVIAGAAPPANSQPEPGAYVHIFFTLRDMFNMAVAAIVATTLCLARRWQQSEMARQVAERERTAAELKNLRSQINPHFLLNTLNNIYALTAIDPQRAQEVVLELSKLLRHMLYDNQKPFVKLEEELTFLTNYINLMKIRLPGNVKVTSSFKVPSPCNINIAPMIFISLVENAFKHGTAPSRPCFINICITADDEKIVCDVENSNFPKSTDDKSGHGIGLKQVASRLELQYPGKYEWTSSTDEKNNTYKSTITIYDTKLCYN